MSPSPWQMLIVAAIALLIFGSKLPTIMRNLGRGVVEFKKGINGVEDEIENASKKSKKKSKKRDEEEEDEEEDDDDSEE